MAALERTGTVQSRITPGRPWVGQQIKDIPLEQSELAVLIRHADGNTDSPHGRTALRNGDTLVVRRIPIQT